ncbi:ComEA family DNA-binding protein [Paenibacillus ihumii]|uniref:ComEA family DNA-binding protein n=1 Tax=Paenibacillus ihumii TaxID=687436 RepID=UPI0006D7CCF1|nr:helix-hairpin-helix domain-containing protein [Paenibacillus ihumii]
MKREYVLTAIASAVIGAGLMLLAAGGSRPAGIEGWTPLNREVAAALAADEGQEAAIAAAAAKASASGAGAAEAAEGQAAAGQEHPAAEGSPARPGMAAGLNPGDEEAAGKAGLAEQSAAGAAIPAAYGSSDTAAAPLPPAEPPQDGLVSINTADSAQLQAVPGIGEKKAQAIIDYRNQHGSFNSLSDLKKVKGIGDKLFQKMKPYIKL